MSHHAGDSRDFGPSFPSSFTPGSVVFGGGSLLMGLFVPLPARKEGQIQISCIGIGLSTHESGESRPSPPRTTREARKEGSESFKKNQMNKFDKFDKFGGLRRGTSPFSVPATAIWIYAFHRWVWDPPKATSTIPDGIADPLWGRRRNVITN